MDLNTVLIILGILALIGLVAHGIWSNRREKSQYFEHANNFGRAQHHQSVNPSEQNETAVPNFAQPTTASPLNVSPQSAVSQQTVQPQAIQPVVPANEVPVAAPSVSVGQAHSVDQIKITLPNADFNQSADEPVHYEYHPEPKQPKANMADYTLADAVDFAETQAQVDMTSPELRVQLQQASSPISEPTLQQPIDNPKTSEPVAQAQPAATDFMLLYVVAPENRQFLGLSIAQSLDNLGFILGKDNLYHRHVDTVASPVMFSVANIEQPGTFNPYAMNEFSTLGLALFMQVPSQVGNNKANLKMMIQAAKNLAEELNGFVLTDQQAIFDDKQEQDYLDRM
ncbi:cell division protein ZipA [Lonepinella sp. BR2271]|uniref:cell division protein ZipA n=1 Tax=Lonepinella sp. BR2271 TaxID=3434550 RepID=UPI003F6DBC87